MREHELDHMLSQERNIVPSARFTKSVMDAVRSEASAPPPLTFPWLRALPLVATGVFTVVWAVIEGFHLYDSQPAPPLPAGWWVERLASLINNLESSGIGWVLLAFLVAAACVELTWRMSDRRT